MNAKSFNLTAQGASHIKKNKECQDASLSYQDENCAIAVVCDGHGGDDYVRSAIGSKFASAIAKKNIQKFLLGMDKEKFLLNPDKQLKILEASIISHWNESVSDYHSKHPFDEAELIVVSEKAKKRYLEDGKIWSAYGTTLIAVAMNEDYWFAIHIGDGKCVAINHAGEFKQPIPWDPKCFLNATTSICDSDAIDNFRHFYSDKLPAAVFVGSDGIDDCFNNNEQLYNLYKTVLYSFATTDFKEACEGLADYLPRLSAKGSGDDVSIAALLDMDSISELSIVKDYDKSKEKAKLEENARKEAEKNEAEKRRVEEERAKIQHQNDTKASEETQIISPKFCENCGEPIKSGAKFCTNCGAEIRCVKSVAQGMLDEQNLKIIKINPFSSEAEAEDNVTVDKEEIDSVPQSSATTSDATLKEDAEQVNIDEDIAQCNDNAEDDDLESGKILKQETDI
ncbi:MAG: zinc-ribbon domain-containing protein [Lachnospiraceae bacterium]|nr:MAG: zinc-ribbon domain-containing protein [Lachnospiraceae bacterium]